MKITELKENEPINGEWCVSGYIRDDGAFSVYNVYNRYGVNAEMRTVVVPDAAMISDYEMKFGKSEETNNKIVEDSEAIMKELTDGLEKIANSPMAEKGFLIIYGYGSFISESGYCLYIITETSVNSGMYKPNATLKEQMIFGLARNFDDAVGFCETEGIVSRTVSVLKFDPSPDFEKTIDPKMIYQGNKDISDDYDKTVALEQNFNDSNVSDETDDPNIISSDYDKTIAPDQNLNGSTVPDDSDDPNIYTMGAQAYYDDAMRNIRNNRHIQVDESVLKDIDKVSKRLAEKYGYESAEFRKFAQKVKSYEDLQSDVKTLKKVNMRRGAVVKILIGICVAAVMVIAYLIINTNIYYINQGRYNHIYCKNLFGNADVFKEISCENLIKSGGDLYYISKSDSKIYSTPVNQREEQNEVTEEKAGSFIISGKYIYYINKSDESRLYRISKDGFDNECISDNSVTSVELDKRNVLFTANDGKSYTYIVKEDEIEEIE